MNFRRLLSIPAFLIFVLPVSPNYQLKDYNFTSGGGDLNSSNYSILSTIGELSQSKLFSPLYNLGLGLIFTLQTNVPITPVLSNPATYYNKLKLVLDNSNNSSDTVFAVAISDDNFVTTSYVKSDNTVSNTLTSQDWRTYTDWGESVGVLIIGLRSNTAYKVKVKANQGKFTESDYSLVAEEYTSALNLSLNISGVSSGTNIEGVITDITTTANGVPFGDLSLNEVLEGAQSFTVTSNANSGYTLLVNQIDDLKNDQFNIFPQVDGTNSSPSSWPISVLSGAYGYHTSDDSLGTGTTDRFANNNTFAKFETIQKEISYSATPVVNETTNVIYSLERGMSLLPGTYSHQIIYTVYGVF